MNEEGIFILYHMANLFLMADYQACKSICKVNFSYVVDSTLFESNFLRLKALAFEKIYLMYQNEDSDESMEDVCKLEDLEISDQILLLIEAIESVKYSLNITIYSAAKQSILKEANAYSCGLAHFQLGLLYEEHYSQLIT